MRRITRSPLLLVAVALAAALSAVTLAAGALTRPVLGQGPRPGPSVCIVTTGKSAGPSPVRLGESVGVTLTVGITCPRQAPLNVALALDGSGNMAGAPTGALKRAATALVALLDLPNHRRDRFVSVVQFDSAARTLSPLTSDWGKATGAINRLGASGGMRIDAGLMEALKTLRQGRGTERDIVEAIVLVADGGNNIGCDPIRQVASQVRGQGVLLFTVCLGPACDQACLRGIATSPTHYRYAAQPVDLVAVLADIARDLVQATRWLPVTRLEVADELGDDVTYVLDSADPPEGVHDATRRTLTWDIGPLFDPPAAPFTFSLRVRPTRLGAVATNKSASGWLADAVGNSAAFTFTVPSVTVIGPATATPSATVPPPPTPTDRPSPSPTLEPRSTTPPATPAATDTATATATPTPNTRYFPYAERIPALVCGGRRIVVFVVDRSPSMLEPAQAGGRNKLDLARAALDLFVAGLDADDGQWAALVWFDAGSTVAQSPTGNKDQLRAAVGRLAPGVEGSRLDLGLAAARVELAGEAARAACRRSVVVIGDGRSVPSVAEAAVDEAAAAARDAIDVHVLGLGSELDLDTLRRIAGDPGRVHGATSAADLPTARAAIQRAIACCTGR